MRPLLLLALLTGCISENTPNRPPLGSCWQDSLGYTYRVWTVLEYSAVICQVPRGRMECTGARDELLEKWSLPVFERRGRTDCWVPQ